MIASPHQRLFRDSRSDREYGSTAREYASLWSEHYPDDAHYVHVRSKYLDWIHDLKKTSDLDTEDGALVVCGPGYNFVGRDMSHEMVAGSVKAHPVIIGADWSTDVLQDFGENIFRASKNVYAKTVLTQRDFSGGLASKFHALVTEKLSRVGDLEGLRDFIKWIGEEVGIEEISRQKPEKSNPSQVNRLINATMDVEDPYNFQYFLEETTSSVRFMTANMLLAGTLALTEKDVREMIMFYRNQMETEELVNMLAVWHKVINTVNTHIASTFIMGALEANPKAHLYMPTDTNVQYEGLDTFDRLDLPHLREKVRTHGYKFVERAQWTLDDSHESPPHTHQMRLLLACAGGEHTEESVQLIHDQDSGTASEMSSDNAMFGEDVHNGN